MSNAGSNRQRTRQDLQDLAKLAKPTGTPLATADSSGYVDLSAFSATDSGWVDRELERARAGHPPAPRGGKSAAINALSPESMAPVSLAALLDIPIEEDVPRRGRKALYVLGGVVSIAAVAFLAVVVARHPPPPAAAAAPAVAPDPQAAAPAPAAVPASTNTDTSATPAPAVAPSATVAPVVVAAAKTPARKASAALAHAPVAAAPHAAAAPRPAAVPQSKPPSSGDSLMDMMRASVKH